MVRPGPLSSSFSSAICRGAAAFSSRPAWSRRSIISKACGSRQPRSTGSRAPAASVRTCSIISPTLRFTGDVDAMPEGTVLFANEPVLRITAPLPQAQFVESRLINILHFQTLIAAKAARIDTRGAEQASGRLWLSPRARRRGRADGCAGKLSHRLCRHRNGARRRSVRHSALRHDGAFFHRGVRR